MVACWWCWTFGSQQKTTQPFSTSFPHLGASATLSGKCLTSVSVATKISLIPKFFRRFSKIVCYFSAVDWPVRGQLGGGVREHGVLQIPRVLLSFRLARFAVQLLEALRFGLLHGDSRGAICLAGGASGKHTEDQEHHQVMTDVEFLVISEISRFVYISPRVRQKVLGFSYEITIWNWPFLNPVWYYNVLMIEVRYNLHDSQIIDRWFNM